MSRRMRLCVPRSSWRRSTARVGGLSRGTKPGWSLIGPTNVGMPNTQSARKQRCGVPVRKVSCYMKKEMTLPQCWPQSNIRMLRKDEVFAAGCFFELFQCAHNCKPFRVALLWVTRLGLYRETAVWWEVAGRLQGCVVCRLSLM